MSLNKFQNFNFDGGKTLFFDISYMMLNSGKKNETNKNEFEAIIFI